MPTPPLRGRRGRDRRIAERVATDFAARHATAPARDAVDFDVAEVEAEVADEARPARAAAKRPGQGGSTLRCRKRLRG